MSRDRNRRASTKRLEIAEPTGGCAFIQASQTHLSFGLARLICPLKADAPGG